MRSNPRSLFLIFLVLTGFVLGVHAIVTLSQRKNTSACMTVFIHGSVFSGLSLLNPASVIDDVLSEDSWYVSLLKEIRTNRLLWEDQLLLQEGWQPISDDVIERFNAQQFTDDDKKIASHFLVPAYDRCVQKEDNQSDRLYYTFGHLGLLSQRYRKEAAEQLYEHLCAEVAHLKQYYNQVNVVIIAHSHGGNIVLNLADSEDKRKQGLVIDDLVMFGTPLQTETTPYAYSPVFKRVVNIHSDGDFIQGADTFSTSTRRSYKLFSDSRLGNTPAPEHAIYDVRILVNNKPRTVDHMNMWFMGKSKRTCDVLYPLPIMIFTPRLLHMLDTQSDDKALDCNVMERTNTLHLELSLRQQQEIVATSANMYPEIEDLSSLVKEHWNPNDKSRAVLLNKKTFSVLYNAWKEVRNGNNKPVEQI